jgi:hypothetical protein
MSLPQQAHLLSPTRRRLTAMYGAENDLMAINWIQFQKGLSLPTFMETYGTRSQCEAALIRARWPDGFRCPTLRWPAGE